MRRCALIVKLNRYIGINIHASTSGSSRNLIIIRANNLISQLELVAKMWLCEQGERNIGRVAVISLSAGCAWFSTKKVPGKSKETRSLILRRDQTFYLARSSLCFQNEVKKFTKKILHTFCWLVFSSVRNIPFATRCNLPHLPAQDTFLARNPAQRLVQLTGVDRRLFGWQSLVGLTRWCCSFELCHGSLYRPSTPSLQQLET